MTPAACFCSWKIKGPGNAADSLGMKPSTPRSHMTRLGIQRPARSQSTDTPSPRSSRSEKGPIGPCGAGSIISAVNELLRRREDEIVALCEHHRVRRLSVFGSAVGETFDPSRSDVDLLVEFEPMPPREHADHFFGLEEDLEALLGVPVDLVEPGPIRNPYFRDAVEASRVLLFEAA